MDVDSIIYLDNHATTRPDPRVLEAIRPYFETKYGNAASRSHLIGWDAEDGLEAAREQVARGIGAETDDIVFTSGSTESNNLAIKGIAFANRLNKKHLVTSSVEHRSVLDVVKRLAREGHSATIVKPNEHGEVSVESIDRALTDQTILVSIMAANNEVGALNPIAEIGALCRSRGVFFHVDATQAIGKIPLDVESRSIDLLSLSGHTIYGPKGIGALFVRRREPAPRLVPLFDGGGQERGLRPGTVAVPLAVGLGAAVELAVKDREVESRRVLELRERLHAGLIRRIPGVRLNGSPTNRLPGNLNVSFEATDGEALGGLLREVAASSGSACSSLEPEPSHVLIAIGLDEDLARASLRFGVGRFNTLDEIDRAVEFVARAVEASRR